MDSLQNLQNNETKVTLTIAEVRALNKLHLDYQQAIEELDTCKATYDTQKAFSDSLFIEFSTLSSMQTRKIHMLDQQLRNKDAMINAVRTDLLDEQKRRRNQVITASSIGLGVAILSFFVGFFIAK